MANQAAKRFSRVIVLSNPVSTHAERSKQYIAELRKYFGSESVLVLETKPGGAGPNQALLRQHAAKLGPKTLLCIASGDGTVGMVIEALLRDPYLSELARSTVVLPVWTGNANDLAHMLNGNAYPNRLRLVLETGTVVRVRPMVCVISAENGDQQTRLATCYASFGATAFATQRLSQADMRTSVFHKIPWLGFLAELVTGFKAAVHSPFFTVEEGESRRRVYERVYMNGSRFAKVERLPLKLTEDSFLEHTLTERSLAALFPQIWRAMQVKLVDKFRVDQSEFGVREHVMAQFDGELLEIEAGSRVKLSVSSEPFYALSILLQDQASYNQS